MALSGVEGGIIVGMNVRWKGKREYRVEVRPMSDRDGRRNGLEEGLHRVLR